MTYLSRLVFAMHGGEDVGRLIAAHNRDPRIRPHEEKGRIVGAATHAVVPCAEAPADDHRQSRYLATRACDRHRGSTGRTWTLETAMTILAPFLAMPPASCFCPVS